MSVEIIFGLIIAIIVFCLIYFNRSSSGLDVNNDGKVDAEDAKKAVENAVEGVKETVKKTAAKPKTTKPAVKPAVQAKTTRNKKTNGTRK